MRISEGECYIKERPQTTGSREAPADEIGRLNLQPTEPSLGWDACHVCLAMAGFNPIQPDHVEQLQRVLPQLLSPHPGEQLLVFAGSGGVFLCAATGSIARLPLAKQDAPVVSLIAAIQLPTIGHALLVEGSNLSTKPHPALFSFAGGGIVGARLQLLKIDTQGGVDRALYDAPKQLRGGSMTLRLCRGAAFGQTFRMENSLFAGMPQTPEPFTDSDKEVHSADDASSGNTDGSCSSGAEETSIEAATPQSGMHEKPLPAVKIGAEEGDLLLYVPGLDSSKPLDTHPAYNRLVALSRQNPGQRLLLHAGGDSLVRCIGGDVQLAPPPAAVQQQRPVVSVMAAIGLPTGGRAILVEGTNLTAPSELPALFCFLQGRLAAELLPLLNTASQAGKDRALFAAPQLLQGEMLLLQLQRDGLFAQSFMMPVKLLAQDLEATSDQAQLGSGATQPDEPRHPAAPSEDGSPQEQGNPPAAPPAPESADGNQRRRQQTPRKPQVSPKDKQQRQQQWEALQRQQSQNLASTSSGSNTRLNLDNKYRHHLRQWNVVGASQAAREPKMQK